MSFDIVQNKLKSRQRPGQTNEISLFAGLLKCGECGKSLTIRYTNAKHPQRIYSCKTYNAFGKNHCTQHRIDYDTLYSLSLIHISKRNTIWIFCASGIPTNAPKSCSSRWQTANWTGYDGD